MAWQNALAGGSPLVPAYLAGHPLAMRQRVRIASQHAPMAIVVDTTISSGISNETIRKRGAAILALVRLLGAVRPIELYAACGIGSNQHDGATWFFARIETAPLDLGRAGFALCNPTFPRGIFYEVGRSRCVNPNGFSGNWPYSDHDTAQKRFHDVCKRWLPHIDEFLALPGAHYNDPTTENPEAWIKDKLAIFAPMVAT